MNNKSGEYFADFSLMAISVIWGSTFIIIKKTVELFDPITFVGVRFTLAFLFMLIFCYPRRDKFSMSLLADGLKIGAALAVVYIFQTLALKFSSASEVGFITGAYVLFVPLLSLVFLKKKAHFFSWIGVAFSVWGMVLITMTNHLSLSTGQFFALINAFFIAVQIVMTDSYSRKHDALLLTAVEIGVVAAAAMAYSACFESFDFSAVSQPFVIKSLLFNSLIATVFCLFVQMNMQKHTTPTKAAIIFTIEPISAAFFSFFLGNELLTGRQYTGAAMIVLAIVLAEAGTYLRHKKNTVL